MRGLNQGGLNMGPRWRHVLGGSIRGASIWALGGGMSWGAQSGGLNMGPRWRHVLEPQSGGPFYGYPCFYPCFRLFCPRRPRLCPRTPVLGDFYPLSAISLKSHPRHFNFFRHLPAILLLLPHRGAKTHFLPLYRLIGHLDSFRHFFTLYAHRRPL